MPYSSNLEESAKRIFEQEWRMVDGHDVGGVENRLCACPPVWLLPDLLAMIEERHNQPASQLTGTIRQMILEQNFVDANGDGLINEDEENRVDRLVEVLVRVLEKVRKRALQQGAVVGIASDATDVRLNSRYIHHVLAGYL